MNRRGFLKVASQTAATIALPVSGKGADQAEPQRRPNVLWLLADQWRAQSLAINGDPNAHTPNLDRLARSGINFAQARSGFPLCCPFRGTMLTSRYPHHMVPGHEFQLPPKQITIAKLFNDADYRTGFFGKWHLDGFHESGGRAAMHVVPPERRGEFQTWIGYENNNSPWDCWVHGNDKQGETAPHKLPGYETDALTDLLLDYLRDRVAEKGTPQEKPFFAVLSIEPPHNPYIAPAEYMRRYNPSQIRLRPNVPFHAAILDDAEETDAGSSRSVEERAREELAGYYAQIECWDANVGRIVKLLNDSGILADTHIMIFSDHGDMHGSQGQFLKTIPYEEAVRIPMIVSGSEAFYDGHRTGRSNVLFSAVDIAPTTLGLCGLAAPSWMEGHDFSGERLASRRRITPPDSMYMQNVIPTGHPDSIDTSYRGLVTAEGWKYVCFPGQSWLLFNLNDDPFEQANLAFNSIYRAERNALIERLQRWVKETDDNFVLPRAT